MEAVAIAHRKDELPNRQLGAGVLRFDKGHLAAASRDGKTIHDGF